MTTSVNISHFEDVTLRRVTTDLPATWNNVLTIYSKGSSTCWIYLSTDELAKIQTAIGEYLAAQAEVAHD